MITDFFGTAFLGYRTDLTRFRSFYLQTHRRKRPLDPCSLPLSSETSENIKTNANISTTKKQKQIIKKRQTFSIFGLPAMSFKPKFLFLSSSTSFIKFLLVMTLTFSWSRIDCCTFAEVRYKWICMNAQSGSCICCSSISIKRSRNHSNSAKLRFSQTKSTFFNDFCSTLSYHWLLHFLVNYCINLQTS